MSSSVSWLSDKPIAHRGLHDGLDCFENTVEAFTRAAEEGYAIELDVRVTKDNEIIVFHDERADRLTGVDEAIIDLTLNDIRELYIGGRFKIPTLIEVLLIVNCKVPLLIEMKQCGKGNHSSMLSVLEILDGYKGKVALQSFDIELLYKIKKCSTKIPLGYLSHGPSIDNLSLFFCFFEYIKINLLKPLFIGYQYNKLPKWYSYFLRRRFILIIWTIRNSNDLDKYLKFSDNYIFEKFIPR